MTMLRPLPLLSLAALLLFVGVLWSDQPLVEAGHSMVELQFAGSAERAARILDTWRTAGVEDAIRLNQQIDFAFLLTYPAALSLACRSLAGHLGPGQRIGHFLTRAVFACTVLDGAENLAIQVMLDHGARDSMARLATACAIPKFALAAWAIGWCLWALLRRVRPP